MSIFHDDVTYILRDEIPKYILPYIDDVLIRGPKTRYKLPEGGVKTLDQNPGIRKFVFEYLENVNRILQKMKHAGGIFLGPKMTICSDHIIIVGFECLYEGRKPTNDTIRKILRWGSCEDTTDIRVFLGTAVQCRNHIPNFVTVVAPLYEIVKKGIPFEWGPTQQKVQQDLKILIEDCFHMRNPKFPSEQPLVLAVDTL